MGGVGVVERDDHCFRHGEQNGGMYRRDDLCADFHGHAEAVEEFRLAQYRQAGFKFVKESQRFGVETTFGQRHDGSVVVHLGEVYRFSATW